MSVCTLSIIVIIIYIMYFKYNCYNSIHNVLSTFVSDFSSTTASTARVALCQRPREAPLALCLTAMAALVDDVHGVTCKAAKCPVTTICRISESVLKSHRHCYIAVTSVLKSHSQYLRCLVSQLGMSLFLSQRRQ